MSLGTLTYGGASMNDVGSGRYIASSVVFGGARNELKLSGATFVKKASPPAYIGSFTRILEYPVSTNPLDAEATLTNRRLTLTIQISAQEGITPTDIKGQIDASATFLTNAMITSIMNGAQ